MMEFKTSSELLGILNNHKKLAKVVSTDDDINYYTTKRYPHEDEPSLIMNIDAGVVYFSKIMYKDDRFYLFNGEVYIGEFRLSLGASYYAIGD